jgi:hypothetical protein
MNKNRWIFTLVVLLVSSLACSVFTGGAKTSATDVSPDSNGGAKATIAPAGGNKVKATATMQGESDVEATATTAEKAPGGFDTEFPLPTDVSNFTSTGNGGINFQTKMSLKNVIAFYREAFTKIGYKERQINTAITDTTFSMVFDGHASGKAIVIQGVDLGGTSTNVNIRFEDV